MITEGRGQYYFDLDENNSLAVQKQPLGIAPKPTRFERLKHGFNSFVKSFDPPVRIIRPEDILSDPRTTDEMKLVHDVLLYDLKEKGVLDIVARETQIDPVLWIDHEKVSDPVSPPRDPNVWEVDLSGPRYRYIERPSGHSRWSPEGCVSITEIPQNYIHIELSIGPEWDERFVNLHYDRHRDLTIQGAETSKINLNEEGSRYLFQEHLRDAMKDPYNPYWETPNGFLSPAATRKHIHDFQQKQKVA